MKLEFAKMKKIIESVLCLALALLICMVTGVKAEASNKISFLNEEENAWIEEHDRLRVGFVDNYQPFCYKNEYGNVDGVITYVCDVIVEKLDGDISIEYVPYNSFQEMADGLNAGQCDISFPVIGEKYYMDALNVRSTTEIVNVPMYIAYEGDYSDKIYDVIAINTRPLKTLSSYYPNATILHYDSSEDCLEAVLDGEATCTIMASYRLDEFLMESKYRKLCTMPYGESVSYCIGIAEDNALVYSLMNKVAFRVDKTVVTNRIWEELNSHKVYTAHDFLEENTMGIIWMILIIFGLIVAILAIFLSREAKSKKILEESLRRSEAFSASYFACWEVNVDNNTIVELNVPDYGKDIVKISEGDATKAMDIFANNYIGDDNQKKQVKEFMDIERVAKRLREVATASIEYKGKYNGWCRLTVVPEKKNEDGRVLSYLIGVKVIQEEKRLLDEALEKAQEANRAKSTFLFNMSHDIRTPMNAIMGFTDLIEKHIDEKELTLNYLGKIKSANDFLLSLVNNVLEMARIESGKMVLEEKYWDAKAFNDSLYNVFYDSMQKKGIVFERSADIIHTDVLCDSTKLREIFLNLISNACKYTPSGGKVRLLLTEIPSEREGYARFKTIVEDNGIGMSKEFVEHIFDEFAREKSSTESRVEGTGLGMSIVKKLIDLMQGTIVIDSEKGKGTRITVILDHKIATEEDIENAKKSEQSVGEFDFGGRRILLAEDNDLNAEIAITVLEDAGFNVERAEDGQVCVDMLTESPANYYDLILMDVQMPNMDGYEATRTIRAMKDLDKADIIILAMTANAFSEDKLNAIEAGMNGHLAKPINIPTLLETLAKYLAK